ncbi:MAG TPA: permease [Chthoniobacterales bacterium]|nr:permease [Chthoniobacterales bacterium]
MSWFDFRWQNFWFSFLALIFEGIPFVLVGSLISGFIAAFIPSRVITGLLPRNRLVAILVSGLLGFIFPVCECGIVPIVRRLLRKGLPLSCGVTYMLASPIVNPIVLCSTFFAFRAQAPVLNTGLRLGLGYLVAVLVGLAVAFVKKPSAILRKGNTGSSSQQRAGFRIAMIPDSQSVDFRVTKISKIVGAVRMASDDFLETAFYFTIGAAIAATFNTAVNQQLILPLASSSTLSIVAMMALSGILTLCSTSDAFIAVTFVTFPMAARLAFLVFGPMFDLKLFFLYSVLFKKRFVVGLGIGLFLLVGLLCESLVAGIYARQGF